MSKKKTLLWGAVIAAIVAMPGAAAAVTVAKQHLVLKTKTYEISIEYPHTGVRAIDDVLAKYAKDQAAEDKSTGVVDDVPQRAFDFGTTYEIGRNDGQMFAVVFTEYADTGGAHPNTNYTAFNFLMPSGALVYLPELLDGARGMARVSTLAIDDLTKQVGGPDGMSDADWIKRGAGPRAPNFDVFVLEPKDLHIFFPPYQVAAYAAGTQETKIPLALLKGYMRRDPLAPQPSFDCSKAATAIEHAICGDAALARLDRQTAEQYGEDLANSYEKTDAEKWRSSQREWLANRNKTCGGGDPAPCLRKSYAARMAALKKYTP